MIEWHRHTYCFNLPPCPFFSASLGRSECQSLREQLVFSLQHDGPVVISETKSQTLTLQTQVANTDTAAGVTATTPTTPQGNQMSSSSSSSLSSIREFRSFLAEIDSDNPYRNYDTTNNDISASTPSSSEDEDDEDDDKGKQLMLVPRATNKVATMDLSLTKELRRLDDLERFHLEYLNQMNTC